jgi:hypothetical protein
VQVLGAKDTSTIYANPVDAAFKAMGVEWRRKNMPECGHCNTTREVNIEQTKVATAYSGQRLTDTLSRELVADSDPRTDPFGVGRVACSQGKAAGNAYLDDRIAAWRRIGNDMRRLWTTRTGTSRGDFCCESGFASRDAISRFQK